MQAFEKDKLQQAREQNGTKGRFKRQLLGYNTQVVDSLYEKYDTICAENKKTIQEMSEREQALQKINRELTEQLENWQQSVKEQYELMDELTRMPLQNQIDILQDKLDELTLERNNLSAQLFAAEESLRHTESQNSMLKERLLKTNAQLTARNLAIRQSHTELSLEMEQIQSVSDYMSEELSQMAHHMIDELQSQTKKLKEHRQNSIESLQTLYSEICPQASTYPEVLALGSLKIQADCG